MPLPPDCSLSLLAHTHPGESDYSKPKQAMIVRMSAETLDALQSYNGEKPPMDFEFGDTPGIHIGNTFYPMRPLKEDTPHELYLRTSSAAKQMAPLKLYANVTGKFTVERELGDKVKDMLRVKTSDAAKQRDDRRTKFIDAPPTLPPSNSKKRKEPPTSSMFRNAIRPADQAKLNASTSSTATPARVSSPIPPRKKTSAASATLRKRLVHCLAVSERPRDQALKLVAGGDSDASTRRDVLELLEELGEPVSALKKGEDPGSKKWCLKTESWKEVRPFEWPKLPEQDRVAMARTGRQKLSSLGITPTDVLWEHFVFRTQQNNAATTSSSSAGTSRMNAGNETGPGIKTEAAPKRGVSSKEAKEKKAKPKTDPNAEIQMKDESIRTAARVSSGNGKAKESEGAPQSNAKPITGSRKVPGSGFRVGRSTSQEERDTVRDSSPATRSKPEVRSMKDREVSSTSAAKPSPLASNVEKKSVASASLQRVRKVRDSDAGGGGTDSERERNLDRSRDMGKGRNDKDQADERRKASGATSLKRKQPLQNGNDSEAISKAAPQKKRRVENGAVPVASPSKDSKVKDPTPLRKPDPEPPLRPKIKKEPSPLPPPAPLPKIRKDTTSTTTRPPGPARDGRPFPQEPPSSAQPRGRSESKSTNASNKPRRKSPIYTSSEDEGEIRRPRRDNPSNTLPTPPTTNNHSAGHTPSTSISRSRPREPRPLPSDHTDLRARYSSTYLEYLAAFQKMVTQKGKIDSILKHKEGSTTESDGDDVMDSEELRSLRSNYQRLHDELATIRSMFSKESD